MASRMAVGARTWVHQGFSPSGKDFLRALVRETKYGADDAAQVAQLVTVREMAPPGFTVAKALRGRRQLDSLRTQAAILGKVAAMAGASG